MITSVKNWNPKIETCLSMTLDKTAWYFKEQWVLFDHKNALCISRQCVWSLESAYDEIFCSSLLGHLLHDYKCAYLCDIVWDIVHRRSVWCWFCNSLLFDKSTTKRHLFLRDHVIKILPIIYTMFIIVIMCLTLN